ncbi:hypothetical protein Bpfe_023025 [Biomphalaria pfeifferi]|uniref:Uncharacterized protein n=1 Tax=Biomphalaria pfeifferi TaxID=112525 RepID=A0AAD8B3S3_BIOPF|nr:hypothetical protein Bpfe_023025 [Biomphalaria pfeifferi]
MSCCGGDASARSSPLFELPLLTPVAARYVLKMPYNHPSVSYTYCDRPYYKSGSCSPLSTDSLHSPVSSSYPSAACPRGGREVLTYGHLDDAQPLDLSVRTKSHEPVAKRPRLDYAIKEHIDFPSVYSYVDNNVQQASPYTLQHSGMSRSPNSVPSPTVPLESSYHVYSHRSPSPGYFAGNFKPGAYQAVLSEGYQSNQYHEEDQSPVLHDFNTQSVVYTKVVNEKRLVADSERGGADSSAYYPKGVKTYQDGSCSWNGRPSVQLSNKNYKEESELSRLLGSSKSPDLKVRVVSEGLAPAMKPTLTELKCEQSVKPLLHSHDRCQAPAGGLTNQALTSSSVSQHSDTALPQSDVTSPVSTISSSGRPQGHGELPLKIKSKKSLLLSRTAGLYHDLVTPERSAAQQEVKVADTPPPVGIQEGVNDSNKISFIDFCISKILMERCEEAPKKPCSVDYIRHTPDGQKKIRISLVDLIELQVEHSLKA